MATAAVPMISSELIEMELHELGFEVDNVEVSKEQKGAIDAYGYQYMRNCSKSITTSTHTYNEFYVYLKEVKYTFIAEDLDLSKALKNHRFEKVTKTEKEHRVFHVHYTEEEQEDKIPFNWILELLDCYWQYPLTKEQFDKLLDEQITPLERYLQYGLNK